MKKVITCTGYYCTGSSAITDLFSEFDNVSCKGEVEMRFVYDPYGISDLEYNIIDNPNRHNTDNAIKKFLYIMKFWSRVGPIKRYEKHFNNKLMFLTYQYVKELVTFKYTGSWHYDIYERGRIFYIFDRLFYKIKQLLNRLFNCKFQGRGLISKNANSYLCNINEKGFIEATKKYTRNLINEYDKEDKEFIMMDQVVPSSNIERYIRYFDDIKVVVVDRDPRDVFLFEMLKLRGTIVPHDVKQFCEWYKWTRSLDKNKNSCTNKNIKYIYFEDLIYHYDETVESLIDFVGLDKNNHVNKFKYFKPEISKKNTRLWEQNSIYNEDIKYIEKELSIFLYNKY